MDLYNINEARSQGNARTASNQLYNEQILTARDNINNSLDRESIQAKAGVSKAKSDASQDKMLYEFHDTLASVGFGSGVHSIGKSISAYKKVSAATGGQEGFFRSQRELAVQNNPRLKAVYGDATILNDKPAAAVGAKVKTMTGDIGAEPTNPMDRAAAAKKSVLGEGPEADAVWNESSPEDRAKIVNNYSPSGETAASNANTPSVTSTKPSATASLENETEGVLNKAKSKISGAVEGGISKASLGLKAVGAVGGAVSAYELATGGLAGTVDPKTGKKKYDVAADVGQVSGLIGTGLDIVGTFIPALEPLGALATGISAIADTIDSHKTDTDKVTDATNEQNSVETRRTSQIAALGPLKQMNAPVNQMVSSGLVATGQQHVQNATQGTGSF